MHFKNANVDVLSKTISATIDLAAVEHKNQLLVELSRQGYEVVKEHGEIYTVKKTDW